MVDRNIFMETLRSVQEIAKAAPEPMTREEIQDYFRDMELSSEQQEMIYQYLLRPQEDSEQEGAIEEAGKEKQPKGRKSAGGGKKASHSRHFQLYLSEIGKIPDLPEEGKMELYRKLLAGERNAVSDISTQWLKRITEIAADYVTGRVLVEDLVQEGNMGLLIGMEELLGTGEQNEELLHDRQALEDRLESFVREAMKQYRQETEGMDNSEHTILAKVNLLHEARKALAEENGTIPAMQELSEYTRLPLEEVRDIMALSQKKGE